MMSVIFGRVRLTNGYAEDNHMVYRQELQNHLETLSDISDIMKAMKNLSLMESRKLNRYLVTQKRVVQSIEAAALDLLKFHPQLTPSVSDDHVIVIIGSERGFCGDFNQRVLYKLNEYLGEHVIRDPILIPVGTKLSVAMEQDKRIYQALVGALVAEEIETVLIVLVDVINELSSRLGLPNLIVIHQNLHGIISVETVFPPFSQRHNPNSSRLDQYGTKPLINLRPEVLFANLLEYYLYALLHQIYFVTLAAEHERRVQHLDGAVHRLSEKIEKLTVKRNTLRQEEITEEIEVIMLSAGIVEEDVQQW